MSKLSQSVSRVIFFMISDNRTAVKIPDGTATTSREHLYGSKPHKQVVAGIVAEIVAGSGKKTVFQNQREIAGNYMVTVYRKTQQCAQKTVRARNATPHVCPATFLILLTWQKCVQMTSQCSPPLSLRRHLPRRHFMRGVCRAVSIWWKSLLAL